LLSNIRANYDVIATFGGEAPAGEVVEWMRRHNPSAIPRNHKVEEALAAAVETGDLSVMERLLAVLAKPYDYSQAHPEYDVPSNSDSYRTFCGT